MLRILRNQDGIALIMTMGLMMALAVVGSTALYYTTANQHSAKYSEASGGAYSIAEAGVAEAISRLAVAVDPGDDSLLPTTGPVTVGNGTVTYAGVLNGDVWTITSTGSLLNPTGSSTRDVTRTLTREVTITGLNAGSLGPFWERIHQESTAQCFSIPVNIPANVTTKSDLCLESGGSISGASTKVAVAGNVTLNGAGGAHVTKGAGAGTGWTNPGNIGSSNNQNATTSLAAGATSTTIDATSFALAVPSGAVIKGITAKIERKTSVASTIQDFEVYLLKNGVPIGTNKLASGIYWGTGDASRTYGSSSDFWGTTWAPEDVNSSTFGLRLKAKNFHGSTTALGSIDYVEIEVEYGTGWSFIGTNGTPVTSVDVAGSCTAGTNPANSPCSRADNVYAGAISATNTVLTKPTIDYNFWFKNARPGPKHPCTESSGTPPTFDDNGTGPNGSNPEQEVTPENVDYMCRVRDAQGTVIGELSWTRATRVLTVKGTIFFDGKMAFRDSDKIVHYQGRATMWTYDQWHNDEIVCAGGSGSTTCRGAPANQPANSTMETWDPLTNMLVIIANINGNDDAFDFHQNAAFQGVLYGGGKCKMHDEMAMSGPVLCDRFELTGHPTFWRWPPLPGIADGQVYNGGTKLDKQLIVGPQTG